MERSEKHLPQSRHGWTLYQKFTALLILLGLLPITILCVIFVNKGIRNNREAMEDSYRQEIRYANLITENLLDSYNSISKLMYEYSGNGSVSQRGSQSILENYDNFRKLLVIEDEEERGRELLLFLKTAADSDTYIQAAHFVSCLDEEAQWYHYKKTNSSFYDPELFAGKIGYESWNYSNKKLILIGPHDTRYEGSSNNTVFTIARNYYDIRGTIGKEKYVGTLFLDIDIQKLNLLFHGMKLNSYQEFYCTDADGFCYYSSDEKKEGSNLSDHIREKTENPDYIVLRTTANEYGLFCTAVIDIHAAFSGLETLRLSMLLILAASSLILILFSFLFSRRLTVPIDHMMKEMDKIETGNFDIELPVRKNDEIGILSERFNQMSRELKSYIEKSYVAQLKQNEAELTSLRAQIYPHFLYNTLEVIRMTALDSGDLQVSLMIESLSEQIHYLIGAPEDMVPLKKEADIVRKYVYLLNCRIRGKVFLDISLGELEEFLIPRLILQPIVENAYVHGIKPKEGQGSILIEAMKKEGHVEISVMDNGIGMNEETIDRLKKLLEGDEIGIRNEYNWQSVGLKNVHDRIRFLYGEEYGITITGSPGTGTLVTVKLPFMRKGKEENYADNDHRG